MRKRKSTWTRASDMAKKYMMLVKQDWSVPDTYSKTDEQTLNVLKWYLTDAWYSGYKQGRRDLRKELKDA